MKNFDNIYLTKNPNKQPPNTSFIFNFDQKSENTQENTIFISEASEEEILSFLIKISEISKEKKVALLYYKEEYKDVMLKFLSSYLMMFWDYSIEMVTNHLASPNCIGEELNETTISWLCNFENTIPFNETKSKYCYFDICEKHITFNNKKKKKIEHQENSELVEDKIQLPPFIN